MDIISFLKTSFSGQDVHVVIPDGAYNKHVGYYFWEKGIDQHKLQLIREMRTDIGLDVMDIRQLCADAKIVKVHLSGEDAILA
jgi:hypothetical protein